MTGVCRRSPAVEGHEAGTGWGEVCAGGRQGVREKGRAQSYAVQGKGWIVLHDGGGSSARYPGGAPQMLTQDPRTWGPGRPQQDEVEGDGGMG